MQKFENVKIGDTVIILIEASFKDNNKDFYVSATISKIVNNHFFVSIKNKENEYRKSDGYLIRKNKMPSRYFRALFENEAPDESKEYNDFLEKGIIFEKLMDSINKLNEVSHLLNSNISKDKMLEAKFAIDQLIKL